MAMKQVQLGTHPSPTNLCSFDQELKWDRDKFCIQPWEWIGGGDKVPPSLPAPTLPYYLFIIIYNFF